MLPGKVKPPPLTLVECVGHAIKLYTSVPTVQPGSRLCGFMGTALGHGSKVLFSADQLSKGQISYRDDNRKTMYYSIKGCKEIRLAWIITGVCRS